MPTADLDRPSRDLVKLAPKVLLHEHLDGGLRPATVLELAKECGYDDLPESEVAPLADWFHAGAARGALGLYLEGFRHTIAVMQTAEALERVAYEFMEDMAADNVVYAAVLRGLRRGSEDFDVGYGLIVCAMRNEPPELSLKLAELAVAYRERGCVGFDLAGEEAGHPAKEHLNAFHYCLRMNFSITIHAGESFGPESIWQALQYCGAHRIGHGTRLIEDIVVYEGKVIKLGALAEYVLDKRIPIEVCLSSNIHTGAAPSMAEHPFRTYWDMGFRVTLNTDNRLMSRTTMTDEYMVAVAQFGCDLSALEKLTINGMKSAFAHYGDRVLFIFNRIKAGYTQLRAEAQG